MKSEIVLNKVEDSVEFPCLMKLPIEQYDIIVLFSDKKSGTVISSNSIVHRVGSFNDNREIARYEPFKDKLILSN